MTGVIENVETSALDDRHKRLFRFLAKVNDEPSRIGAGDFGPLKQAGWTDEELYFAISACALFNFYNRWVDAMGVHDLSDEAYREGAKRSAALGYARK